MKSSFKKTLAYIDNWMSGFSWEPDHMRQVARLADVIFDDLKILHGLCEEDRFLLQAACLTHDVGFLRDESRHHKASRDLILKHDFPGVSPHQKKLFAMVVRYHRKARPKKKHSRFSALSAKDRDRVRKMAAIIRVADGLDRSHLNVVRDLECDFTEKRVTMMVFVGDHPDAELYGARKKSKLFKEVFNRDLVIDLNFIEKTLSLG